MILERKEAIWQIDEINFLAPVIEKLEINTSNRGRFTLFFRILVLLIHAGLGIASNKKHGYFLKKYFEKWPFCLMEKLYQSRILKNLVCVLLILFFL
ncbi:hypothetical protein B5C00_03785 [Staphylococcus delphini]|nr:hypothetical protein B5C00_03785 [Staphylococcus delphini]